MRDEPIQFDDREFRLSRYLDGDLSADETRALEQELQRDSRLQGLLAEYRRADRLIKSAGPPMPQMDWEKFAQQVQWRCRTSGKSGRRWTMLRVGLPVAAAAALALAFLLRVEFGNAPGQGHGPVVDATGASGPALPGATADTDKVVVSVVFDRTPPHEALEGAPPEEESSYVIAAAGAGPLVGAADEDEYAPTF